MIRNLMRVGSSLLLLSAAGCCAGPQYLATVDGVADTQPPEGWRAGLLADYRAYLAQCENAPAPPSAGAYPMLMLSWGGSYGAWGAGFLTGWYESASPPPQFRVVTGVSTGALMATPAFLATEHDRGFLKDAYTLTVDADIWRSRPIWQLLCASSLRTAVPMVATVERTITDAVIDRVAAEGKKGRKLLIATVDLSRGEPRVWDLTAVAMSGRPERYKQYRALLLASAALPALFEPVLVDGHLQVDGGIGTRIFPDDALFSEFADAGAAVAARPKARLPTAEAAGDAAQAAGVKSRLAALGPAAYVLVNTPIHTSPKKPPETALAIARRALSVMLYANAAAELRRLADLFRRNGWEGFRASYIPRSVPLNGLQPEDFDPLRMNRIFDFAFEHGREGRWDRFPVPAPDPTQRPNPSPDD